MKRLLTYIFLFFFSAALTAQNGERIELKEIRFLGNTALSSTELLSVILSKESPSKFNQFLFSFSSFGGEAVYFDSILIPTDIQAIKQLYQSNGYFKTRVNAEHEISSEDKEAILTFNIDESAPAYIGSLKVIGLETIDPEYIVRLSDYALVDTSQIYKDQIVEEKKNYIITFLRDHGFMLATVNIPDILVDTMKNRADITINFIPGKRYKISDIQAVRTGEGKDLVDDQLLKDVVGIKPGEWYSYYEIQRGQVRLYRTNLFTSTVVNSVISDTVGNMVPINISADVGLLHELAPEIIINNEDNTFNAGLGLNFIKKNFLGNARKLTISTSAAAQNFSEFIKNPSFSDSTIFGYGDARVSIEQPFLFGKPINTQMSTYLTSQKRKEEYNSTLLGAKLSFDFEMPQFLYFNSFNTYLNVEQSRYTFKEPYLIRLLSRYIQESSAEPMPQNIADSLAAITVRDSLGGSLQSQGTNALIGFSLGANKTNDVFFPSEGFSLSLQIEDVNSISYLFSKIFGSEFTRPMFLKTTLSTTAYLPIYASKENAFGIKFRIGNIFNYHGDKANISLNQRLYAGGSNSVRGWSTRQLVPSQELLILTDPTLEELESVLLRSATTGGFFLMEGSIETRNRIIGRLGSALFLDFGNTWNGAKEFRYDEVAVAAGFGIRYYSDFAPIRIDFGIKVYDPHTKRLTFGNNFWGHFFKDYLQFHIGIGEAF